MSLKQIAYWTAVASLVLVILQVYVAFKDAAKAS